MPFPANVELDSGRYLIDSSFTISLKGNYDARLEKEATRFLRRLDRKTGSFFFQNKVKGEQQDAALTIQVERPAKVQLHEDESYTLTIRSQNIELRAITDLGAIRGLETLLQLTDASKEGYFFPEARITDEPRFAWRGLMLDVARHYMPIGVIFRNLDAMAALKLNVLHLHLSDDQGFRFASDAFPKLTEIASDGNFYTREQLRKVVEYADQRGIRVIPEIDVPGHATAILAAYPELGSKDTIYEVERYAGIFDPTLNPANEEVYAFLQILFEEVSEVFPDPFFHLGGDENLGKHWDNSEEIQEFMAKNKLKTNHDLQTFFNIRLQKILSGLNKRVMGWEEIMTPDMPKTAVIHSWRGEWEGVTPKKSLYDAAKSGYETILSNGYYLDLMQPASAHYLMDPAPSDADLTDKERKRILGGEMCMWSELVVPETVDSRIWPRGAAIAERFWSPENVKDVEDMYRRLDVVSLQLEQLGLQHLSARNMILRNLTNSTDLDPLKVLLDLVEPMKGYSRNPGGTMYASYSPFRLWADAAIPDASVARNFNTCVVKYLNGQQDSQQIISYLNEWEGNHKKVLPIIETSPVLLEIKELSASLSEIAIIGRQAVAFMESGEAPHKSWFDASRKALNVASQNGGRTELQVVSGITALVNQVETLAK